MNREFEQSKRHACRVLRLQAEHSKALYILGRIKKDESKRTENQVTAGLVVTAALGLAVVVAGTLAGGGGGRQRR